MIEAIGIIVPAHNEADHIAACMTSIEAARERVAPDIETHVVLVLDHCRDDTRGAAATAFRRSHAIIDVAYANVGRARAHAAAVLMRHFSDCDPARLWLATTDADSEVPACWLQDQLQVARSGYDACAGTVQVADWEAHGYEPHYVREYDAFYDRDDCESGVHPHVHGANLGVRANVYAAVGGFPPLATGEDHALWQALAKAGYKTLSTRAIQVLTSARLHARAPQGFATFLAEFSASGN
ncbi:MAG: glycosyltransferase [Polyangiales bacterium]